jgi:splicing factor 3B subunit 3
MKLLDVSLKNAGSIIASVIGEFTSGDDTATSSSGSPDLTPTQEIACLRAGGTIDLYRILVSTPSTSSPIGSGSDEVNDEEEMTTITLKLVSRVKTRSTLRCLATLRPTGTKHDVLVVGSDSGRFSILDFEKCGVATFGDGGVELSVLPDILHCPTHGKSGVRRDSPGQYIACDPCGRAVMITSIEKRKLVYIVHRDTTGKVMLASPLEAHRPRTLVFDTVGLDNGYDNPIFGCLEVQYEDHEETVDGRVPVLVGTNGDGYTKQLAYYELDLGLNHVCRRWATTVSRTACCLASIPGGANGPGGVLVGGEDYVEYVHEGMSHLPTGGNRVEGKKASRMMCALPRREHHPPNKGVLITSMTVLKQKKNKFFALAQTELGDVYKITLGLHKGKGGNDSGRTTVLSVVTCLLDTLPVGNCLNISKLALLFIPSEFGDHFLYQFDAIDIEDDAVKCSSTTTLAAYLNSDVVNENSFYSMSETVSSFAPTFRPTMLKNLHKVCVLDSLAPVTSVLVGELAGSEVSPQVYALCGRGPMSALRVLRHGLSVTELAVSELPGIPGAVFNVRDNDSAKNKGRKCYDRYIVVSFADATLVLAVGESVEEMGRESGFLMTEPTLACSALGGGNGAGGGGIVQVYPGGVRHIQRGSVSQWHVPGIKKIECASANEYQILVALVGGELIYFEVNPLSGNVTEVGTRDIGADVCSLDVGAVPYGKSRSLFVAVGCRDSTVRLLSLVPGEGMLEQKSITALGTTKPHSVVLSNVYLRGGGCEISLTVGLDDGSAIKAVVDPITGAISTSPTRRFLGARPVTASRITFRGMQSTLLLSSRPWIADQHDMSPLSYTPLDHGCSFSNEAVTEGIIATSGNTLRILSFDRGGNGDDILTGLVLERTRLSIFRVSPCATPPVRCVFCPHVSLNCRVRSFSR